MQPQRNTSAHHHKGIGTYDYPVEPGTDAAVQPSRYRWEPYSLRAAQEMRSNNPYKPHPQQLFTSRDVHPVFPEYADMFAHNCSRLFYCSFGVSCAADDEPSIRLLVKNFPLVHLGQRRKFLMAVIYAVANIRTHMTVEDPRRSRTNTAFFDNNIFLWVPQRFVAAILAVSGRVLCDMDSFLVEHGGVPSGTLYQYGHDVREYLSQDQRHERTRGLPTQPLVFEVSHVQR
jgi:hypothetical protein